MKEQAANLFKDEPTRWGLRGDPVLWQEMQMRLTQLQDWPDNKAEFKVLLETTYEQIVGVPLLATNDSAILVERFKQASSGMSSGHISPQFWRNKGIPLLLARYEALIGNPVMRFLSACGKAIHF